MTQTVHGANRMNIKDFRNSVLSVDWEQYRGPQYYNPNDVPNALLALAELDTLDLATEVGDRVTKSLGNDHAGTYYPAIVSGIDLIIQLEKSVGSKARQICARSILNNFFYFEPELGTYKGWDAEELKVFIVEKLLPYSDQ
jgi:hypothetical protein